MPCSFPFTCLSFSLSSSRYARLLRCHAQVLIHIRPRRLKRLSTTRKPPSRHATIGRSSHSLDGSVDSAASTGLTPSSSPSRLSSSPRDANDSVPSGDVRDASLSTSPRQRLISSTNSDPRINTQQFPDHLLEQLDLEVVYEVVESADKETSNVVGDAARAAV